MSPPQWETIRREFRALSGRTFLNTATYGQLPQRAIEAVSAHLRRRDEKACADFIRWFDDLDRLRGSIGCLINASAEDIAFVPSASYGLAMIMNGISWKAGDEIVTLEDEFPNQLYAAQSLSGVRAVQCHWPDLEEHITERTKLVLLSTVNYSTGLRPDLGAVAARLRHRGILLYVDGTQSLGALRFDCRAVQPDIFAVDAYKWMISPNGAGFVYVHPEVRKWLRPNVIGWRSDADWRNVNTLHHGAARVSASAEKYEGGMLVFPSLYGMQGSLELIEQVGKQAIEARVLELANLVRQELDSLGAERDPISDGYLPSQIVSVRFPGHDASAMAQELGRKNIIVAARKGHLRISPHFYNNEADVSVLAGALREILRL